MENINTKESSDSQQTADRSRYLIPSVNSAVQILKYLSKRKNQTSTLSQMTADLELNRSTAYRILTTLHLNNMVDYDTENRTYSLGTEVAVLGARAMANNELLRRADQILQRVKHLTQSTTVLVQRTSFHKFAYVLKSEPATPVHVSASIGQEFPITAGSHGKLFLAYMDPMEREAILHQLGYPQYTQHAISEPIRLEDELKSVRESGVAVSWEEHIVGVGGVAVPVFRDQQLVATISCITMTANKEPSQLYEWGRIMKQIVLDELC